jgi:hypothetical protein
MKVRVRPVRRRTRIELADLRKPSALSLDAANLVPLYGVLALGWEVFPLIFLFWFENVIVGLFNVLRMLATPPYDFKGWTTKAFVVPFFCVHYGMFTAAHGLFVMVLFGGFGTDGAPFPGPGAVAASMKRFGLFLPVAILFLSHGFSFAWNFLGKGEVRRTSLNELMARPYSRVVVLHLTLIFGGFLLTALGSPVAGLLLFLVLKIGFDLRAHLREHAEPPSAGG